MIIMMKQRSLSTLHCQISQKITLLDSVMQMKMGLKLRDTLLIGRHTANLSV